MFYVMHGYSSPDRCQRSGNDHVLELARLESEEVLKLHEDYESVRENGECSNVTFVVIEGSERKVRPAETVFYYRLS